MDADELHVRWACRMDMPGILAIENQAFKYPETEDEFVRFLRKRNAVMMVAVFQEAVVGFMLYKIYKECIRVERFAVAKDFRRFGVGTRMTDILKMKLQPDRRNRIELAVSECNYIAHKFFQAMGFRATKVLRNFCNDGDAYEMVFEREETRRKYFPRNRFSKGEPYVADI